MSYNAEQRFVWLDLIFLSILAAISEWMSNGLLHVWKSQFYFSFSIAICLIAMVRWGTVGVVAGMFGGIPQLMFSDMSLGHGILFYVVANVFLCIPMLCYGKRNRDAISDNVLLLIFYVLLCHVCLAIGKGLAIFLITGEQTGYIDYFGATFLVMVMDIIVCLLLRTRDGLLCDMRYYFDKEKMNYEGQ